MMKKNGAIQGLKTPSEYSQQQQLPLCGYRNNRQFLIKVFGISEIYIQKSEFFLKIRIYF